jgi:hypothetical protein
VKYFEVVVDGVCRSIRQDYHISDEVDQVKRDHTTGSEGEGCELRRDDDGNDVREKHSAEAVKEEDDEEIPGGEPSIRCTNENCCSDAGNDEYKDKVKAGVCQP